MVLWFRRRGCRAGARGNFGGRESSEAPITVGASFSPQLKPEGARAREHIATEGPLNVQYARVEPLGTLRRLAALPGLSPDSTGMPNLL